MRTTKEADLNAALLQYVNKCRAERDDRALAHLGLDRHDVEAAASLCLSDLDHLSALHFPLLRDGPIDRDLFHRLIDHLHHLRALESVRDALLTRDAPLPLMHHLFGMDPTEYAEHGRRLGLIRPTGRPSEPAEAEETTVWEACKALRKPKGEDLTPEDYLDALQNHGTVAPDDLAGRSARPGQTAACDSIATPPGAGPVPMTEAGWHRKEPSDPAAGLSGPGPSGPDPLRAADPRTLALEAYIEASMEQLLRGDPRAQAHGLIFLSSWHEAMPALVHQDPVLDPVDSRVFAVLWIWAKQQGRGALAFPSYDDLLRRCNVHSRSTLARSLAILRITRWVTLCRRVRDRSGRNRGNIYALHDEPLALASTLYLDPDYMQFLEIKARDRHDRVVRVAKAMRASLQERIDEGEDVLASSPLSQTEQRLEAIATVAGKGSGHYFWLRQGALATLQTAKKDPPDQAQEKGKNRVQKLDSGTHD